MRFSVKRSTIDHLIDQAIALLKKHQFFLPPFAYWTPETWRTKGAEYNEIRDNMLGWDITDFGSENFEKVGLLLFTIRNGNFHNHAYTKTYAEKMLLVNENQMTPYHFHWNKIEDIICRGGGNLLVQVYNRTKDERLDEQNDVVISVDGCRRTLKAGSILRLTPGESVTLTQGIYHGFWAEKGTGTALLGEVSQTNDDQADNRFLISNVRFPIIEEDQPKRHLLCTDYR